MQISWALFAMELPESESINNDWTADVSSVFRIRLLSFTLFDGGFLFRLNRATWKRWDECYFCILLK